jgi:hypothetical protein
MPELCGPSHRVPRAPRSCATWSFIQNSVLSGSKRRKSSHCGCPRQVSGLSGGSLHRVPWGQSVEPQELLDSDQAGPLVATQKA